MSACVLSPDANAIEFGEIHHNDTYIDYSKIDRSSTLQKADFYFQKAQQTSDEAERKLFLQQAAGEYFLLSQVNKKSLYPIVQLARIYDYSNKNRYSKAYFYQALRIDKLNPATNYFFGDYYYKREEYHKALLYYNTAFENGYKENYDVLLKMATMYEKLGDLLRANQYYKKAFLIKPNNEEIPDKIRGLEGLNYKSTGYYDRQKRK